jgi:hypothetical protein
VVGEDVTKAQKPSSPQQEEEVVGVEPEEETQDDTASRAMNDVPSAASGAMNNAPGAENACG